LVICRAGLEELVGGLETFVCFDGFFTKSNVTLLTGATGRQ